MSGKIEFTDLAVQKLFQNFYSVPQYQREYVWEEKQVSQLLGDINDAFSSNPETDYFLGSLVVCKVQDSHKYEVIDGQQRLITLSLMLNNLRRIFKGRGESYTKVENLLCDETITEAGETVRSNIVDVQYEGKEVLYDLYRTDNDDDIDPTTVEGLPGMTIFEAHQTIAFFFAETFKQDEIKELKRFLGYFLNKVKLIQIETPDIGNALKIFETINERGISLDQVDLLKNLLFMQIGRQDFSKLKTEWDKFKGSISGHKEKERPLRFLRYFIMSNYEIGKDEKGTRIIREDDIYTWFMNNERKCNYRTDSFGFVRKIQEDADFYINLMRKRYHQDNNLHLDDISKLVGNGFKQHFLLLLSARHLKPEFFDHLIKQLEVLLFYYNITKEAPRDVEKRFADWAGELRKIRTADHLNQFIQEKIMTDVENRSRTFEANFMQLTDSSMQKYKLKYVLGKLAQYVDKERIGDADTSSLEPYTKRSIEIEHVLPANPDPKIVEDFSNGDTEIYNDFKKRLGNLTLLEKPINASIQRDFFPDKLREYSKSMFYLTRSIGTLDYVGTNTSINRINSLLSSFSTWDTDAIDKRHQMLFELSKRVWQIRIFT